MTNIHELDKKSLLKNLEEAIRKAEMIKKDYSSNNSFYDNATSNIVTNTNYDDSEKESQNLYELSVRVNLETSSDSKTINIPIYKISYKKTKGPDKFDILNLSEELNNDKVVLGRSHAFSYIQKLAEEREKEIDIVLDTYKTLHSF